VALLEKGRREILYKLSSLKIDPKSLNGWSFQELALSTLIDCSIGTSFEGTIRGSGANSFPDIVIDSCFGVEVKVTGGDKWISLGNSVLETSRVDTVEHIYLFFGKMGGTPDIRFRKYEECLSGIGVTHYPRYKIDMNLDPRNSIFTKMGISYDELSNEANPVSKVKAYYRSQLNEGESLWWIDPTSDSAAASPVIHTYDSLAREDRKRFLLDCFILFPEMFGTSQTKFERAATYLMTDYSTVSSSLRDKFTAGGQESVHLGPVNLIVPKIYFKLFCGARDLRAHLENIPDEKLIEHWPVMSAPSDTLEYWKGLLDKKADHKCLNGHRPSDVFEAGLRFAPYHDSDGF